MPISVRYVRIFLSATVKKNPQEGLVVNDVARLFNELNIRRASPDRAQSVSFFPLVELWCLFHDSEARMETVGTQRRIRGFSFKDDDIRRLASIFVNGTGASSDNLETINRLFAPLMNLSDTAPLS